MNTADLLAHSNILVESAITTRHKLRALIDRGDSIREWLQANDLHPMDSSISPLLSDVGFQLVYSFHIDYLLPFARIEKAFWRYVDDLVMIDHGTRDHLTVGHPLAGITVDERGWKVVITPHPDAMLDLFPDHDFWESAALAEDTIEQERKEDLFQHLVSVVRAALDSEKGEDHDAAIVVALPQGA